MIRRKTETRGRYDVGVYEVDIDVDMRRDALQFAKDIICIQNDVCHAFGEYHIWLHIVGVGCGYCFRCNIFTLLWCYSKCN